MESHDGFYVDDTTSYYSRKAASWILEDSCMDYMIKVSGEIGVSVVYMCYSARI